MSRKTVQWRKAIRQAGNRPHKLLPTRAVSTGRMEPAKATGKVGTQPMKDATVARFMALEKWIKPKR